MGAAAYASRAAEFSIENSVVCVRMQTGEEVHCFHMPLLEFRRSLSRAAKLIDQYDNRGEVVPMRGMG